MFIDTAHVDPPVLASNSDHRDLRVDEFWRSLPAYEKISAKEFRTHTFQTCATLRRFSFLTLNSLPGM